MAQKNLTREQKLAQMTDLRRSAAASGVNLAAQQTQKERKTASLVAPTTRMKSGVAGTTLSPAIAGAVEAQASSVAKGGFIPTTAQKRVTARGLAQAEGDKTLAAQSQQQQSERDKVRNQEIARLETTDPELQKIARQEANLRQKGVYGQTGSEEGLKARREARIEQLLGSSSALQQFDTQSGLQKTQEAQNVLRSLGRRTREFAAGGAGTTTDKMRAFLGISEDSDFDLTEVDGQFRVVSKDLEEKGVEIDSFQRAESRLEKDRQDGYRDINDSYAPLLNEIEAEKINGKLSTQSKKRLADLRRRKKKSIEDFEERVNRSREDLLIQEEGRQSRIDAQLAAQRAEVLEAQELDPLKELQKRAAQEKAGRINEYVEQGYTVETAMMLAEKDEEALESGLEETDLKRVNSVISGYGDISSVPRDGSPYEQMFALGSESVDDITKSFAAKVGEDKARQLKKQYLESLGVDKIKVEQDDLDWLGERLFSGELKGDVGISSFVDQAKKVGLADVQIKDRLRGVKYSPYVDSVTRGLASDYVEELTSAEKVDIRKDDNGNFVRFEQMSDGSIRTSLVSMPSIGEGVASRPGTVEFYASLDDDDVLREFAIATTLDEQNAVETMLKATQGRPSDQDTKLAYRKYLINKARGVTLDQFLDSADGFIQVASEDRGRQDFAKELGLGNFEREKNQALMRRLNDGDRNGFYRDLEEASLSRFETGVASQQILDSLHEQYTDLDTLLSDSRSKSVLGSISAIGETFRLTRQLDSAEDEAYARQLAGAMNNIALTLRSELFGAATGAGDEKFTDEMQATLYDQPAEVYAKATQSIERVLANNNSNRGLAGLPKIEFDDIPRDRRYKIYESYIGAKYPPESDDFGAEEYQSDFFDFSDNGASKNSVFNKGVDVREDVGFIESVQGLAGNLKTNFEDFMSVVKAETAGSFDHTIRNPKGSATGLIQFTEETAKGLGTTTEALAKMTPQEQLTYVEKYLAPKLKNIENPTKEDIYMAVAAPAFLGKPDGTVVYKKGSKAWDANQGWRPKSGGDITVGSIGDFINKYSYSQ